MTKTRSTKHALLSCALSLLLCISMLIGSTFAWFTDSVTSGSNVIKSGKLDLSVEYTLDGENWENLDGASDLFQKNRWEPGHTEVAVLKIKNSGSLALKYVANMNITKETVGKNKQGDNIVLSDILTVSTLTQQANDENGVGDISLLLAYYGEEYLKYQTTTAFKSANILSEEMRLLPGDEFYLFIKVDMAESIGNEANHNGINIPTIQFGINVLATQYTSESDSFGTDYDKNASYGQIVDSGSCGGVDWTLTEFGTLTVTPNASEEAGAWSEAVIYDANGNATAIGGYPYDVKAVKSLVIADGVTSIGSFTAKFPNLTGEVVIPASVTYIGQEAFQNCPITKLIFEEGGTEELCIAPGAFKKLAVEEIVLPSDRPVHIHCWAFEGCKSLKRVTLPASVTSFQGWNHVEYCGMDYVNGWDSQVFSACTNLESITFGSQAVHDKFFQAAGNRGNINSIGNVTIIIE